MAVWLLLPLSLQGCVLGVAWIAAVGTHNAMLGEGGVELHPFENSWVVPPADREPLRSMQRIVVAPYPGDTAPVPAVAIPDSESLSVQVLSPEDLRALGGPVQPDATATDVASLTIARRLGQRLGVDCVLFSRITEEVAPLEGTASTLRISKRLRVHLVSAQGVTLWTDELPFTLIIGRDQPSDDQVWETLFSRVVLRVHELS